jgi:hypothetical protein
MWCCSRRTRCPKNVCISGSMAPASAPVWSAASKKRLDDLPSREGRVQVTLPCSFRWGGSHTVVLLAWPKGSAKRMGVITPNPRSTRGLHASVYRATLMVRRIRLEEALFQARWISCWSVCYFMLGCVWLHALSGVPCCSVCDFMLKCVWFHAEVHVVSCWSVCVTSCGNVCDCMLPECALHAELWVTSCGIMCVFHSDVQWGDVKWCHWSDVKWCHRSDVKWYHRSDIL